MTTSGSRLAALLKRVRRVTSTRGKKADLGRFLAVPQSRISEWLSGTHEPGGEIALRLLEWVEAEEHEQTDPERVDARPGSETQTRRIQSNENPNSGPKRPYPKPID